MTKPYTLETISKMLDVLSISAIADYFPNEKGASEFLSLINTWWSVSNSKSKFANIRLRDAAKDNDHVTFKNHK